MDSLIRTQIDEAFGNIRQIPLKKLRVIDRTKKTIKDLKVGSCLKYENTFYLVKDKYQYFEGKKQKLSGEEYQLVDVLTGDLKYLEYSEDDGVEIFITTRSVSSKEINESLPHTDERFIRKEVKDFTLKNDNMDYHYDDDWKSTFVRDGVAKEDGEIVRMVEFESDDEETYLTFEFWEDGSMEAFISKEINSYEIEIISI